MRPIQLDFDGFGDLPLEERHAIVVAWMNTLTTIYEKTAAERNRLRAALEDILVGAEQRSQSHVDVALKCRAALREAEATR